MDGLDLFTSDVGCSMFTTALVK